jgi:hypothetical protein
MSTFRTAYLRWETKYVKNKKSSLNETTLKIKKNITQMTLKTKQYFFVHFWILLLNFLKKYFKNFWSKVLTKIMTDIKVC